MPPNQSKTNSSHSTCTAYPDYLGTEFPSALATALNSPAAANRPWSRQHPPAEIAADQTPTRQNSSTDRVSQAHFPNPASPDSHRPRSAKHGMLHPQWPLQSFPPARTFLESLLSKRKLTAHPAATHPRSRNAAPSASVPVAHFYLAV